MKIKVTIDQLIRWDKERRQDSFVNFRDRKKIAAFYKKNGYSVTKAINKINDLIQQYYVFDVIKVDPSGEPLLHPIKKQRFHEGKPILIDPEKKKEFQDKYSILLNTLVIIEA